MRFSKSARLITRVAVRSFRLRKLKVVCNCRAWLARFHVAVRSFRLRKLKVLKGVGCGGVPEVAVRSFRLRKLKVHSAGRRTLAR